MAVFNEPTQWDHELGNNADVSTLPDDTGATTGVASLQKLFQLINQTPLEAGGVAPDREDFNALFKILGDSVFYGMNGGLASYNPAYDYVVGRYVVYNDTLYKCIQANGASSTVVAPDSVSPLGSDYWVQVATLADFTNFANTDLSNLSVTGQSVIDGKADIDLSNVTAPVQAFKEMSAKWGLPKWTAPVLIQSTSFEGNVTAPDDGYLYYQCRGGDGPNLTINNSVVISVRLSGNAYDQGPQLLPVQKGDVIYITSENAIYFIPCEKNQ